MPSKPTIRVVRPTTPCYCSVCDAPNAFRVRLVNPAVVQPGGFALCDKHAEQLGGLLLNHVRRARFVARTNPVTVSPITST